MSRKTRTLWALSALAAALVAVDGAGWWFVTGRMETELAAWRHAQEARGTVVRTGPALRSGWPLQAELILPDVTLATDTPDQADAISWQTDRVRFVYAPWRPAAVDILIDGPQRIRFGTASPVNLMVERLDIHLPIDSAGQAQGVAMAATNLSLPLPGGAVRLSSLSLLVREADAFVSASNATLPGRTLPFGGTIASLDVHARSTGPIPALRDPAAALAAWRDHGQRLLLDDFTLRWGPLDVRGHASLGLDTGLQPEGTASVQVTGFAESTEALALAGTITPGNARVATTLLGLMSQPGAGQRPEADLPLTIRDRTISVGAIPLFRFPPLSLP